MKETLIILTDLWGLDKAEWLNQYVDNLKDSFYIRIYDSCDLGSVDKYVDSKEELHSQFISGGIEKAAMTLLKKEKQKVNLLGFSIGGVIAWKTALLGLKTNKMILISSTRLRYEILKPRCDIKLYYGEHDHHKPSQDWFDSQKVECRIIPKGEHNVYRDSDMIKKVVEDITKQKL